MEWGNSSNNACGALLQSCMHTLNISCVNDDQPTRRQSDSIIDLFIVSPPLVRKIIHCQTLTHGQVRSDHISVLLEMYRCKTDSSDVRQERYCMNNVSWEEWHNVSEREFMDFNNRTNNTMDLSSLYSDFGDTFNKCKWKKWFQRNS